MLKVYFCYRCNNKRPFKSGLKIFRRNWLQHWGFHVLILASGTVQEEMDGFLWNALCMKIWRLLWNKLFHDISGATFSTLTCPLLSKGECWQGGAHSSAVPPHRSFLLKVKSSSESWQLLVAISISAAVEAHYVGVVPHTGGNINLLLREETIMMLLIDAFICMWMYKCYLY